MDVVFNVIYLLSTLFLACCHGKSSVCIVYRYFAFLYGVGEKVNLTSKIPPTPSCFFSCISLIPDYYQEDTLKYVLYNWCKVFFIYFL